MEARQGGRTVRWGSVTLGEGMPKVCVPVMGGSLDALRQAARRAAHARADVIELRIDSLSPMPDADTALSACRAVREAAGDIPLLFTLRTARDGGPGSADAAAYEKLLCTLVKARAFEAVDCELSVGEEAFARIVRAAHAAGVSVVGSSHEFGEIGDMARAADWLARQQELGADVCKAAVMTRDRVQALEAALTMTRMGETLRVPMIAIAMGPAGVLTRVCCECMGSCLTFGTAGEASAPGQTDAAALRAAMDTIHAAMA